MLQNEIRLKLKEYLHSRVELIYKTQDTIQGEIEWVSPDGQMAEIRLSNGEIRTICDTELMNVIKR